MSTNESAAFRGHPHAPDSVPHARRGNASERGRLIDDPRTLAERAAASKAANFPRKYLSVVETDHARHPGVGGVSGLASHARAMKKAGAIVHLLLRGNAVKYCVRSQSQSALRLRRDIQPDRDVVSLVASGADIYYVENDVSALEIAPHDLIDGLKPVRGSDLSTLLDSYDRVWHW